MPADRAVVARLVAVQVLNLYDVSAALGEQLFGNAPLFEQLVVEPGHHDVHRRTVGEMGERLVFAQFGDRVQIRAHRQQVVGRLVRAEAVGEHPSGEQRRQPHPAFVRQLSCRITPFETKRLRHGFRVGHPGVPHSPCRP